VERLHRVRFHTLLAFVLAFFFVLAHVPLEYFEVLPFSFSVLQKLIRKKAILM
jgi:apolipoprotein N-acyltransferase